MANSEIVLVFLHGWSVTHTDTYGSLPERLVGELRESGKPARIEDVHLGRYISFQDEVRVKDIARAFEQAVKDQLLTILKDTGRFVCVTHSTGAPVVREWWQRFYRDTKPVRACPMSHLIMLAPANFGSALAQLGKSRVSRLKHWAQGVEPGQGVLDWLELGSAESWDLNLRWIETDAQGIGAAGMFPFVLTGQRVDRSFYDSLNTYTGEVGSDGVVRVASANLNSRLIRLKQEQPLLVDEKDGIWKAKHLQYVSITESPPTAFRVVKNRAHSGTGMGIMRSVTKRIGGAKNKDTVDAIVECILVRNRNDYRKLAREFDATTNVIQEEEHIEVETGLFRKPRYFIHDRCSMVVFRVRDDEGYPVEDYDLVLVAGEQSDSNHLPRGFFVDKQRNKVNPECITFFFNYNVMNGSPELWYEGQDNGGTRTKVRDAVPGAESLGFRIEPRPSQGFVHYLPCEIKASQKLLEAALRPNSTTLVDIELRRVVFKNVARLDRTTRPHSFKHLPPGDKIVD